jgi:hypothetical protein
MQERIMKRFFPVTSAVFAVLLMHAAPAFAQVRWGRGAVPRSGACFYENSDFGGRYFCAGPGDTMSSLPNGMGDEISSIRTFGGARVTVFNDTGFRGGSARFDRDVVNLKRQGWNDRISSIRIEGGGFFGGDQDRDRDRDRDRPRPGFGNRVPQWGRGPMTRNGACFFEDSGFRGRYFCVERGESVASLPPGFNDRISSIRVFGRRGVEIFVNDDFRGRSSRITRDAPRLGSSWGDRISSLRVF